MFANADHPKVVPERLSHSKISITLDHYGHLILALQRKASGPD